MDIQEEKFNELFDLWVDVVHKENVKNFGSLMADALKVSLTVMRDVNKNFFDEGVEFAQKVAVPEGFVLIKDDTKTVVAIERMVEQQVEASGMDSRRLERLDGWTIIEAAVKAQEQVE